MRAREAEWTYRLSPLEIVEIETAVKAVQARGAGNLHLVAVTGRVDLAHQPLSGIAPNAAIIGFKTRIVSDLQQLVPTRLRPVAVSPERRPPRTTRRRRRHPIAGQRRY